MAEEEKNTVDVEQQLGIMIHSQYIKDMSLEIPYAPEIFKEMNKNPEVHVDISLANKPADKDVYEVALTVKINADLGEKKLFIFSAALFSSIILLSSTSFFKSVTIRSPVTRLTFGV